jgi:hypothetical protein
VTAPAAAVDRPGEGRVYPAPDANDEIVEHPNTTGIISVLDPKHLSDWRMKMGLLGTALREDIAVQVGAAHLLPAGPKRNKELRRLAEAACEAGQILEKGHLANDRGTGYHALTERLDELVPPGAVEMVDVLGLPKSMAEIAKEYVACMAGVTILRSEISCGSNVLTPPYMGTIDRVIGFAPMDEWTAVFDQYDLARGCFAFDAKFGTVHDTVAMQLAAAANAEFIWDAATQTKLPMPEGLRLDVGFVFNPDKGLIPVDLDGAFDAFLGALAVKHYQLRKIKPLHPALGKVNGRVTASTGAEVATAPTPPTTEPVHVAEVLPQAIAAIPDEPTPQALVEATFPGATVVSSDDPADDLLGDQPLTELAPDFDDTATTKRAWLKAQYDELVAMGERGIVALAAHWPADVPNMRLADEQKLLYSATDLAAIEAALIAAGAQAWAPLPDPDPTDPRNQPVANDDPRVLALIERGTQLPDDIANDVRFRAFKEAGVPSLRMRALNEQHVADADRIITAAEATWEARRVTIGLALEACTTSSMVAERTVLRLLGAEQPRDLTAASVERLDVIADAFLGRYLVSSEDGQKVVVDEAAVLKSFPEPCRKSVLAAARTAAKAAGMDSPASCEAALADPILVALFCAT